MKSFILTTLVFVTPLSLWAVSPLTNSDAVNESIGDWPFLASPLVHTVGNRVLINGTNKKLFIYDLDGSLVRDLDPTPEYGFARIGSVPKYNAIVVAELSKKREDGYYRRKAYLIDTDGNYMGPLVDPYLPDPYAVYFNALLPMANDSERLLFSEFKFSLVHPDLPHNRVRSLREVSIDYVDDLSIILSSNETEPGFIINYESDVFHTRVMDGKKSPQYFLKEWAIYKAGKFHYVDQVEREVNIFGFDGPLSRKRGVIAFELDNDINPKIVTLNKKNHQSIFDYWVSTTRLTTYREYGSYYLFTWEGPTPSSHLTGKKSVGEFQFYAQLRNSVGQPINNKIIKRPEGLYAGIIDDKLILVGQSGDRGKKKYWIEAIPMLQLEAD